VSVDDAYGELDSFHKTSADAYNENRESTEFWSYLLANIQSWIDAEGNPVELTNDLRVLHAIKNILENPDDVEILNKKAIFLYLRELTGLNTKQIATSLKKYREKYRNFKKKWDES